jgi:hypothetical protein
MADNEVLARLPLCMLGATCVRSHNLCALTVPCKSEGRWSSTTHAEVRIAGGVKALECHNMRMLLGLNPSSSDAMYQHIRRGVLCNVTRLPEGRKLLLEDSITPRSVTDMLKTSRRSRKRGAASTLRTLRLCRRDGTMDTIIGDRM